MTTVEHILSCSVEAWYPRFKTFSFRSRIVPLPKSFVDYLVQDGIYLPEGNSAVRFRLSRTCAALVIFRSLTSGFNLQLPKRASPDQSALEDEYRDWSDEDSSDSDEHAQQVLI